jgi:hypothetical protein
MKIINNYFLTIILICVLMSCKKTDLKPIAEQKITDSISFSMDRTSYTFNQTNLVGIVNRQINIKPFSEAIAGRDYAYETAGKFWYGTPDSTMYAAQFGLISDTNPGSLEITFNKKYRTSDLTKSLIVKAPKDQSEIFKPGKLPFAIDYDKENTREGVVMEFYVKGRSLTTKKPGFSIYIQSHRMDVQDDSSFEILKVDHIGGDQYLMEARFTLNLFDAEENLYRVENGFLRKNINMSHNMASF